MGALIYNRADVAVLQEGQTSVTALSQSTIIINVLHFFFFYFFFFFLLLFMGVFCSLEDYISVICKISIFL